MFTPSEAKKIDESYDKHHKNNTNTSSSRIRLPLPPALIIVVSIVVIILFILFLIPSALPLFEDQEPFLNLKVTKSPHFGTMSITPSTFGDLSAEQTELFEKDTSFCHMISVRVNENDKDMYDSVPELVDNGTSFRPQEFCPIEYEIECGSYEEIKMKNNRYAEATKNAGRRTTFLAEKFEPGRVQYRRKRVSKNAKSKNERPYRKAKALVLYVVTSGQDAEVLPTEEFNIHYFIRHGLIPANTPTVLFDAV
jgi:hypothetical protein